MLYVRKLNRKIFLNIHLYHEYTDKTLMHATNRSIKLSSNLFLPRYAICSGMLHYDGHVECLYYAVWQMKAVSLLVDYTLIFILIKTK